MPPGSPRVPQGRPAVPPGPMVGDMVAQWWGALPPKPPGMSAANQAASVGIDFQQGHRLRIQDFPDMGFKIFKMTPFWTNRCAIDGTWASKNLK